MVVVKEFDITVEEQEQLNEYPDESVRYALNRYKVQRGITNAFRWVLKVTDIHASKVAAGFRSVSGELPSTGSPAPNHRGEFTRQIQKGVKASSMLEYRLLPEDEANKRRDEFLRNPETLKGIETLAAFSGLGDPEKYFVRVVENLKYEEINPRQLPLCGQQICRFFCQCATRKIAEKAQPVKIEEPTSSYQSLSREYDSNWEEVVEEPLF